MDLQRRSHDGERNLLYGKSRPGADQSDRDIVRQRIAPAGARRLDVEFLKHLRGQTEIVRCQQGNSAIALGCFGRIAADRIEQDVGIDEATCGHRGSAPALVDLVARQPIAGAKRHDAIPQRALELLEALEFGFAAREIDKIALHQGRDGSLKLGGPDTSSTVGLIIQCNCDILHSHTYMSSPSAIQALRRLNWLRMTASRPAANVPIPIATAANARVMLPVSVKPSQAPATINTRRRAASAKGWPTTPIPRQAK